MTTRRSVVYDGRIIRVERELAALPNGRTVPMEIVRHRGSVVLIPQPSARRVILIRQYRHVLRRWIWEWPAGSLEPGEAPAAAARRECVEEIGLRPGRIEALGSFYPTPGFCDERMTFYRCTALRPPRRPAALDPDEQIEPRSFTIPEVWRLIDEGEIIDLKTIAGLVLLDRSGRRRTRKRSPVVRA
jgi:ADP-ribose pyrophosphatase